MSITVVLAAVLYILISMVFTPTDNSPHEPIAMAVTESWKGNCSAGSVSEADYDFGVDGTSATLTTALIGLEVVDSNNSIVPVGKASVPSSGSCPLLPSTGGQPWIAVLEGPTDQHLAFWDATGGGSWSAFSGGPGLPQTFTQGEAIIVISGHDMTNYHLGGFSLTSTPVSLGGGGF